MKKLVILVSAIVLTSSSFAQNLKSKKGENYLPETGDWALGIDATPFLSYAGNLLNGNTSNTAPGMNFLTTNQTIVGKLFKDAKTAYRGSLRIGFGSTKSSTFVPGGTDPSQTFENSVKLSGNNIYLSGGLEFRRGNTRLQGYYGGELGFGIGGMKTTNTYGESLSETNPGMGSRLLEDKSGSMFTLGLRGFVGAEYFIIPKLSIGGEFGWGLGLTSVGEGTTKSEYWDMTNKKVATTETKTGKSSTFGIDTDNKNSVFGPAGSLRITFHF
jgi:hypothetical protein